MSLGRLVDCDTLIFRREVRSYFGVGANGTSLSVLVTLPPTFIQCERDSGFEFCLFGRVAQRQAPLRGEGLGEGGRGLPTEAGVWAFGVVVLAPGGQRDAGVMQRREQGLVQEFVPQSTVEAFNEGILGRLSRGDVVPVKLAIIHEPQDRVGGKLGPLSVRMVWTW